MNKKILTTLAVGLAAAATVFANQIQVGYPGSAYGPYQAGTGGEFTFNDVNPEGWLNLSSYASTTKNFGPATYAITSFQTFCIEKSERLGGYANVYDAVLSTAAKAGGAGAVNGADPLSVGTGWLYSQFARGTLANYDYADATQDGRKGSAALLQEAFWWLEQEINTYSANNPFVLAVQGKFANPKADGATTFGVWAINMTQNGDKKQDGMFYVPDGGMTLSLLGMGLVGLGTLRRRMR